MHGFGITTLTEFLILPIHWYISISREIRLMLCGGKGMMRVCIIRISAIRKDVCIRVAGS